MNIHKWGKNILTLLITLLICETSFAHENLYKKARIAQREGRYADAITAYKHYLSQPIDEDALTDEQLKLYTEALMQLMNTYQSMGEPEACIQALQEVYSTSPTLQIRCLRDYYSVLSYALSRTEKMKESEETMLKALSLPLHRATPERYFRDYAYAAAIFYSNPSYQNEVINWCKEALEQANLCKNTSGKQWVTAMLGTLYKRSGQLNRALELYIQSKEEALHRADELGALNSLHALTDLFLYWDIPEYADLYASEALRVEVGMSKVNPMVSAQTYINKGRSLHRLGEIDSVTHYTEEARKRCQSLPYNSGMVDVELLHGTYLTERGEDSLQVGIEELLHVAQEATALNRARAYHQLAQTYLKSSQDAKADEMLDSMYTLLTQCGATMNIELEYEPIIDHYLKAKDEKRTEQYIRLMLREQQVRKEKRVNYNLVETIVELKTEQKNQALKIAKLVQSYQRLWFIVGVVLSVIVIAILVIYLKRQKKLYALDMKKADDKLVSLAQRLHQTNAEKEMREQEMREFLSIKDNREELEELTPSILQTEGEDKFRKYFKLLYPNFLSRLHEKVPSVSHREELFAMLIVLKQDNKHIAELMGIAPRSVLMLRHRLRQKIGLTTELSLDSFVEDVANLQDNPKYKPEQEEEEKDESSEVPNKGK